MNDSDKILQYLIDKTEKNKIDYYKIKNNAVIFNNCDSEDCFINFILTVRGRFNFTEPLYNSFLEAQKNFDKKVCFTIVEHSELPEHSKFYKKKPVNYVFINSKKDEQFNKCLSYNIGAICSPKAKYYLFHDIDILIKKDFFNQIMDNVKNQNAKALQCYTKRRVLNCDIETTNKILKKEIDFNILKEGDFGVNPPMFNGQASLGSKGGSILIESELFWNAGGYTGELFRAYSAEDNFFWENISSLTDIKYADNPSVELFHMWHEPQLGKNPFLYEMENDYLLFQQLPLEHKLKYTGFKKELFKQTELSV